MASALLFLTLSANDALLAVLAWFGTAAGGAAVWRQYERQKRVKLENELDRTQARLEQRILERDANHRALKILTSHAINMPEWAELEDCGPLEARVDQLAGLVRAELEDREA